MASLRTGAKPPVGRGGLSLAKGSGPVAKGAALQERASKPSDRLNPKTVDPFSGSTKNQSAFAAIYSNGGIPCRLVHGSVKHKLAWNTPPEQVAFDPVLVTLAEGLCETIHPYMFVARTGFKEMLEVPNCDGQVVPLLPRLTVAIRNALGAKDSNVVLVGLEALIQLSDVVGPHLNPHLNKLLVPVAKGMMDKKLRDKVVDTLQAVEKNGGRDCLPLIKSKIPTYSSIFT